MGWGLLSSSFQKKKYSYKGATVPHLKLLREQAGEKIKIKVAGGVRTLDEFLYVMT